MFPSVAMKYVTPYKRSGRPVWYLAFWDPKKGKRVYEATPFRIDSPTGRKKTLELAREKSQEASAGKESGASSWDKWVPGFLVTRFGGSPGTYVRVRNGWKPFRLYLAEKKIETPMALDRAAVMDYLPHRLAQKRTCKKPYNRNTIITEMRIARMILNEAVGRNFIAVNPASRLGLKKGPVKEKPEFTDDQIARVRAALKTEPEWMSIAFEIAIHQGCRISETQIPMSDVDLGRQTVTIRGKGGRVFTTALHPGLVPLMERLKSEGREAACKIPQCASMDLRRMFDKLGMKEHSFHCTRVTVITRMARAGVPMGVAMRYVNHASASVHKIYTRLGVHDVSLALDALKLPG